MSTLSMPISTGTITRDGTDAATTAVWRRFPATAYLAIGATLMPLASLKWNIAPLAWVAPVPFLLFLHRARAGWLSRLALLAALLLGANLMTSKLVTDPVPWPIAPGYGIPIALALWLVYLAWDALRRRAGARWAIYTFPALMALAEIAGYRLSPFGVWGAAVNTQLEDLRLLQLASLFGVSGIGFLMALVASMTAALIVAAERRHRLDVAALVVALLGVYTYGSLRLFAEQEGATVRVAGIVADLGPTPAGLPGGEVVARNTNELFARTEEAASRGARLVVWNEAATIIESPEESAFVRRGIEVARRRGIDLVLAYIVPLAEGPARMENKYVWLDERGQVLETYYKHNPVPMEGSVKGDAPLRLVKRPYAQAAGAICYDYDFPGMALGHARLGAGLVVIPSSDWRGIDPYHTHMAKVRAIEGGFSILRPVRWATSGAFDAYGRSRATLSHFEANDRIIEASLPVQRVETLYARIGDSTAVVYALIVLGAMASALRRRGRAIAPMAKVVTVAVTALLIAGCEALPSGVGNPVEEPHEEPTEQPPPVPVVKVTIDAPSTELLVGQMAWIGASVRLDSEVTVLGPVEWSTDATSVVRLHAANEPLVALEAIGVGEARIIARSGPAADTVVMRVGAGV